jgi:hypothetical protein
MNNISPELLPGHPDTVTEIYACREKEGKRTSRPSKALGASRVGIPCERALWYAFRHCFEPEFDGRMYRLFERGDLEEPRMVADLRAIGCTVHEIDPATGKQFGIVALGGHLKGYLDGCALGIPEAPKAWHLLEFKTHSAKNYKALVSKGVLAVKPEHYAQMMIYMHLTGMKRALYLAVNKDTDELYAERIRYDKAQAEALMERAERVITSNEPPARVSDRPDYYLCRWCDATDICFGTPDRTFPVPRLSCRQCCHATPEMDGNGRWSCKGERTLAFDEQLKGCENHLILPGLLVNQEPVDYGKDEGGHDYIVFRDETCGEPEQGTWKHGWCQGGGAFSSAELMHTPLAALRSNMVQAAKEMFGAKVVDPDHDILERYRPNQINVVWKGSLNIERIAEAWQQEFGENVPDEPLRQQHLEGFSAAEYGGERVIVAYTNDKAAEIWERR